MPPHPQRVYRAYASRLVARLPKPSSGNLAATAVLGTSDWHVRLSEDDIGVSVQQPGCSPRWMTFETAPDCVPSLPRSRLTWSMPS